MEGDRPAAGDTPRPHSLVDMVVDRARGSMRSSRFERDHADWARTLAILLCAAIGGCLATGSVALGTAFAVERRIVAAERAAPAVADHMREARVLTDRFTRPGLEGRLTALQRILPEAERLVLVEDRRVTVRTADPDRLRQQLRGTMGIGAYAERGQRMAAEGGVDVTLEER